MLSRRPKVLACALAATLLGRPGNAPASTGPAGERDLFAQFQSPAVDARPFVRWWWNGGRVNEAELERQLDVLHAAGIGGVEINTIGMPVVSIETRIEDHPVVPWLSPEWCRLVRVAAEGAARRGMTADLLVGSGWPLGGRFLPVEQQTQRVRLKRRVVRGPMTLRLSHAELVSGKPSDERIHRDEVEPARTELVFLRLLPTGAHAGEFNPGKELLDTGQPVHEIDVPAGEHELRIGIREWGFTQVKLGAPGADGPVLDHFSADAVRAYFDHMAGTLAPALGGRLGNHLRALFVDSLELDYANWTADLPVEFERRRGYALLPVLPFVLEPEASPPDSAFERTVQQARHDFNLTLVELLQERFIGTFVAFCHEQGVLARLQPYGRETHPLHAPMLVDLPEGEAWLWHDRSRSDGVQQIDSVGVNKLVSSAAHLTDKRRVSFEAMTNAVSPFQETLADFKLLLDQAFLDGINHPILHGYNYSPPDAGLPGWMRFGSFVSERNPWWTALPVFSDYTARVGTVLRASVHQAEVAILPPQADEWGRFGRLYQPYPEVRHPWYLYDLPRAIHHAGNGADFVSEQVLQEAEFRDGRLCYGPQRYEVVVLAEVESIKPATLRALLEFARSGGTIVILGDPPSRRSGLQPTRGEHADEEIEQLSAQLVALGQVRTVVAEPPRCLDVISEELPPSHWKIGRGHALLTRSFEAMVPWARDLLDRVGVEPAVAFAPMSPDVSQVHHATEDVEVFFLANRSRETAVQTTATFPSEIAGNLWKWNPETGDRALVHGDPRTGIPIVLQPHESMLLVFDRTAATDGQRIRLDADPRSQAVTQVLQGSWEIELYGADAAPTQHLSVDQLRDLSTVAATADFGGVAHYRLTFTVDEADGVEWLDLGTVHGLSEATLNGVPLGRCWHGPPMFPVSGALKAGRNQLVVTVRTHLANLMRAKREDPAAQRWASWYPRTPTGLVGPVTLREAAPERVNTKVAGSR